MGKIDKSNFRDMTSKELEQLIKETQKRIQQHNFNIEQISKGCLEFFDLCDKAIAQTEKELQDFQKLLKKYDKN
ncbi:hypothetical protein [Aquimarina algicola]|uniref:Uncharacterized protein n=1 Tax=Aquimarina algicola TaxID=2589995 RepID=A0A504JMD6_9FLAO|nr:hypothetical protein [Aquimarina algicola]TPN88843.1 hypothetical protein FHK87_01115 [Aquimarina algicola]